MYAEFTGKSENHEGLVSILHGREGLKPILHGNERDLKLMPKILVL